jgi:diguanylate cyclase
VDRASASEAVCVGSIPAESKCKRVQEIIVDNKKRTMTDNQILNTEKRQWLQKAEVFAKLDDSELEVVASHSEIISLVSGSLLFNEKDPGDALFIVISGSINIIKQNDNAPPTVIAELIQGDAFGELEFLTASPRNASAVSDTDTRVVRFPSRGVSFDSLMESHPEVAARLLHAFLKMIAGRIRSSNALIKENSPWVQELRRQVYGDKLTGLYNKTYLEEELPVLIKNPDKKVSLLLMKPDNFKYINDTFGHEAGDESLKIMAAALKREIGETGFTLKYMGNELGVILPGKDKKEAFSISEKIRDLFNNLDVTAFTGGTPVQITVSIGITVYPDHGSNAETIISKAHELPLVGRARGGNLILFPEDN